MNTTTPERPSGRIFSPLKNEPAHRTLHRAAESGQHFRIALPCGRVTHPIEPSVAQRLAKVAAVLDLA